MPTAGELEAWLDFRKGEHVAPRKPRKCDECGETKLDTDLIQEDSETQEQIYMCGLCVAKEDFAHHQEQGLDVDCIVKFDGKKQNYLPVSWFTNITYGTLLKDGRILWDYAGNEVNPTEYERIITSEQK